MKAEVKKLALNQETLRNLTVADSQGFFNTKTACATGIPMTCVECNPPARHN